MITAAVFGVPRSFFYLVGETIEQGNEPPRFQTYVAHQRIAMVEDALEKTGEAHRLLVKLMETLAPRSSKA
jgi:hypothetical protein